MAELADAADSKSAGTWYLGGSTPPPGTSTFVISYLGALPNASLNFSRCPNNKIKPNWVRVNGHQEHHPEGSYYIHYLRNGKQCWEKAGKNPAEAARAAEFQLS